MNLLYSILSAFESFLTLNNFCIENLNNKIHDSTKLCCEKLKSSFLQERKNEFEIAKRNLFDDNRIYKRALMNFDEEIQKFRQQVSMKKANFFQNLNSQIEALKIHKLKYKANDFELKEKEDDLLNIQKLKRELINSYCDALESLELEKINLFENLNQEYKVRPFSLEEWSIDTDRRESFKSKEFISEIDVQIISQPGLQQPSKDEENILKDLDADNNLQNIKSVENTINTATLSSNRSIDTDWYLFLT